MKKNIPQRRKGINPAMIYMSEEAKAKTAIRAASEAVRLITLKMYEEGYFNYQDLKNLVENGLKDKPRKKGSNE